MHTRAHTHARAQFTAYCVLYFLYFGHSDRKNIHPNPRPHKLRIQKYFSNLKPLMSFHPASAINLTSFIMKSTGFWE